MANVKITELTDIGTPASDDVLEIVDISTNTSKKVQVSALGGGATPTLQEVTDEGNTTTNTLEHNNGSNLKATLSNDGTIALLSFYNSTYFASTPQGVYAGHGFELGDEYGQGAGISAYVQYDNGFIGIKFSRALATANIMLQLNYGDFAADDITLFLPKGTALISNAVMPISVNGNLADEYGDITISAGGTTDLAYTPSPTNGIVTSSTGTDATLPLADATDAGLLKPADFTQLSTLATDLGLRTREILQDFTAYTTTGVLTEQIISNQAITANDMKINSWLNFITTLDRTGTFNATVAIYLNTTSNSLSGAVKIATASITSTQSLPCFKRDFSINASSVLRGLLATVSSTTDEITASTTSSQSTTTLTLGSAYYLITTVTLNGITDTVTQRAINLKSSK
jgi:hypothetical protein